MSEPTPDELRELAGLLGWQVTLELFGHVESYVIWLEERYGVDIDELPKPTGIGHIIDAMIKRGFSPRIYHKHGLGVGWDHQKFETDHALVLNSYDIIPTLAKTALQALRSTKP